MTVVPGPDTPDTDTPDADIPDTDIPDTDTPDAGIPDTGIPGLRVALIGLGQIAAVHIAALEGFPTVQVVGGVNPQPRRLLFRERPVPVCATVDDLFTRCRPQLVLITVPTPVHVPVLFSLLQRNEDFGIFLEKPLSPQRDDAIAAFRRIAQAHHPFQVLYHTAFAPEVMWATAYVAQHSALLGAVRSFDAVFHDPYSLVAARDRYVSSWADSGINALSVMERFVRLAAREKLRCLDPVQSHYEAVVYATEKHTAHRAHVSRKIYGKITTRWNTLDAAKQTRVFFASGATLQLDHRQMTGTVTQDKTVLASFAAPTKMPRLLQHYTTMHAAYLSKFKPEVKNDLAQKNTGPLVVPWTSPDFVCDTLDDHARLSSLLLG